MSQATGDYVDVGAPAAGVVHVLIDDLETSALRVFPEGLELGLGVLAFVEGGDSGVDADSSVSPSHAGSLA